MSQPSAPTEVVAGQPFHLSVAPGQHLNYKLLRPAPALELRMQWSFPSCMPPSCQPPLTLFAFHSVPYFNGRQGQSREFHLLPSNSSGTHVWNRDPHAHDVYHCASSECTTFCGAASSVAANATCLSAAPPAPQWPEENTGYLYASVSGHFNQPGVTIDGTIEFEWLQASPSLPPPAHSSPRQPLSPSLPAPLGMPPSPSLPPPPLRMSPPSLSPASSQALHASTPDATVLAALTAAAAALGVAACCCLLVVLAFCFAAWRTKAPNEAVVASPSKKGFDLLGRPIPTTDCGHELSSENAPEEPALHETAPHETTSTRDPCSGDRV